MPHRRVLICDTRHQIANALAAQCQRMGWKTLVTDDDAEAGYALLVWHAPAELPQVAILSLDDLNELREFCALLADPEILMHVRIVVLLDDSDVSVSREFAQLGMIPLAKSGDVWPRIEAILDSIPVDAPSSLQETSESPNREPQQTLRADLPGVSKHKHSERVPSSPSATTTASREPL